jgi:hypothetical protein
VPPALLAAQRLRGGHSRAPEAPPEAATVPTHLADLDAGRRMLLHDSRMSRPLVRKSLTALAVVAVLIALVVADWCVQRHEYTRLVDRTSAALEVTDGEGGEPGSREAAIMMQAIPVAFANVEQVSVLPWHRDMRAFRAASVELGAAWTRDAGWWFHNALTGTREQIVTKKFSTMADRMSAAKPAFTEYYTGTIFP